MGKLSERTSVSISKYDWAVDAIEKENARFEAFLDSLPAHRRVSEKEIRGFVKRAKARLEDLVEDKLGGKDTRERRDRESIALDLLATRLRNNEFDADRVQAGGWDISTAESKDGSISFDITIPALDLLEWENMYELVREDPE